MKRTYVLHIVFCALVLLGVAALHAQAPIFDRGLPTANLNNAAGTSRSNVTWGYPGANNPWFLGDDFVLPPAAPGKVWRVTKVRTWATEGPPQPSAYRLGDYFKAITLYGEGLDGALAPIEAGGIPAGTNQSDNPDVNITAVQYVGGVDYQGSGGGFIQIWQIEWTNLDWLVPGGHVIRFGVHATMKSENPGDQNIPGSIWFNHASNATYSGSTQDGADDWLRSFYSLDLVSGESPFSSLYYGFGGKGTDINVQVWAEQVELPLPGFPVDLNGTYICPSITDAGLLYPGVAMASTVADPTHGQVIERSGPGSPVYWPNVQEGTLTPFSDWDGIHPGIKPPEPLVVLTEGAACAADLDLSGTWAATDEFGIALAGAPLAAGIRVTHNGTAFVFELVSRLGIPPWTVKLGGTTYTASPDATRFHVRLMVDAWSGGLLGYVTPLDGTNPGGTHPLQPEPFDNISKHFIPVPWDASIGAYSLPANVGFAAGFTSMTPKALAVAKVSNFQTNQPESVMYLFADDPYVKSAEMIKYRLGMANLVNPINGYQAWLSDSGAVQAFVGGGYTAFPLPLHIAAFGYGPGYAIDGGVNLGSPPVWVDASLALHHFTAGPDGRGWMMIDTDGGPPSNIPTRFGMAYPWVLPHDFYPSDPLHIEYSNVVVVDTVAPSLTNLKATQFTTGDVYPGTNPVILGPITICVDAKDLGPMTCGAGLAKRPLITIPAFGVYNQPMYSGTGNTFCFDYTVTGSEPCGYTDITIDAEDDAGNPAQLYVPNALKINTTNITVNLELAGTIDPGTIVRAIVFNLGVSGGPNPPISFPKDVTFVNGVAATFTLNALNTPSLPSCGSGITVMSAKDPLHTLRRTVTLGGTSPSFTANFTNALNKGLIGGDAAGIGTPEGGDNLIDILDFGVLAWKYNQFVPASTFVGDPLGWNTTSNPHPDFSGDGWVYMGDYSFIANNFLSVGDSLPGMPGPQGTPKEKATVREMLDAGIKIAPFFDLNRDGWVTYNEIATWLILNHGSGGVVGRR